MTFFLMDFSIFEKILDLFIGIVSLKVVCWKQHALKLVRCVCDYILLRTYLKMLSPKHSSFLCRLNGYIELSCPTFVISRPRPLRCRALKTQRPTGRESASDGTPLHEAVASGKVEAAEFLLSKGAALDAKRNDGPGPQSCKQGQKSPEEIQHSEGWHQKSWLLLNVVVSLDLNFQATTTY